MVRRMLPTTPGLAVAGLWLALTGGVGLLGASCADQDPCPEVQMTDGEQGLVVTEAEHGAAWGQDTCGACHVTAVLHRTGCVADVDLEAVRAIVDAEGETACASCHGDNGAQP